LLYSETWTDRLTPDEKDYRLAVSKRANEYAKELLGTSDTFEFLYREVQKKKLSLSNAINNFKGNELLAGLSDDLRNIVLKTRLKVNNFEGSSSKILSTNQISDITFLGIFKVCLEQFESDLLNLKPFMVGRDPPYGLTSSFILENFGNPVISRFPTLRNSWSGSLDYHNSTLLTLKTLMIEEQPSKVSKMVSIYQGIFSFLFVCYFLAGFFLASQMYYWMVDLLTQYRNLRAEEVKLHNVMLTHRAWFIQKFKYDEPMMVSNYMRSSYTSLSSDSLTKGLDKSREHTNHHTGKHSKRVVNKMDMDVGLFSIQMFRGLLLVSLFYICLYILVFLLNQNTFNSTQKKMVFYSNAYEKITNAYHFYLSHSLYATFGNFILISGNKPSIEIGSNIDSLPQLTLIQFMSNERANLQEFFGGEIGQDIDEMLFKDLCAQIPLSNTNFKTDYSICSKNSYASKGFLSFMYHQRDMLGELRDVLSSNQEFLQKSQTDWNLFSIQDYLYSLRTMSFRLASKIVFETVYGKILQAGEEAIARELLRLENRIFLFSRLTPILTNFAFVGIFLALILYTLLGDLKLCSESLFNMLPEVMVGNKIVIRKFNETYAISY